MIVFYVFCLVFAALSLGWAATFGVRGLLRDFSTPLDQPGSALVPEPPTGDNLSQTASPRQAMQAGCAVRPRIRVVLSDPSLSATLSPGWRIK